MSDEILVVLAEHRALRRAQRRNETTNPTARPSATTATAAAAIATMPAVLVRSFTNDRIGRGARVGPRSRRLTR